MTRERANRIRVDVVASDAARDAAFDIRRRVFQDEQGVSAEEEFDDDDALATHVLARADDTPAGTGRIVFHPEYAKIGRMAVLKAWRRCGVGRAIMHALMRIASERQVTRVVLHAQVQAIPFYTALGFAVIGEEFLEANIPHRRMERTLAGA